MKTQNDKSKHTPKQKGSVNFPGYPLYPSDDDIFKKAKEEQEIDPENQKENKTPNEKSGDGILNEKNPENDFSGSDLDIPGVELDDIRETDGNEDEENNIYSSGDDENGAK